MNTASVSPSKMISVARARCIARYRMHSISGRPEELETNLRLANNHTPEMRVTKVISFAYAGGEMRVRLHGGPTNRDWVETRDFRMKDGWLADLYEFLDPHLLSVPFVTPPRQS